MLSDDDTTSDFGEKQQEWKFGLKGFSQVVRLESSGSTCETFTARRRNKMVFIKRLKPELRSAPLHRAAFAKEYELGINLIHPSLPVYRDLQDDYIVIDYVDGVTLADMIAKRDSWLMEPENIRKMLRQLVEVVGYLHDKNVIHSDIKVDNVMITHGTHNTMLIDLDKAYTYTHNNTGGAPTNYGLEAGDKGNPAIDYNGIARIVTRLTKAGFPTGQFARFQRLCKSPDVKPAALLQALDRNKSRARWYWVAALTGIAILSTGLYFGLQKEPLRTGNKADVPAQSQPNRPDINAEMSAEMSAEINAEISAAISADTPLSDDAQPIDQRQQTPLPSAPETESRSEEYVWDYLPEEQGVSNAAKAKIVATQAVTRVTDVLYCHLDDLSKMRKDTTLTSTQLLAALRDFTAREERYFEAIKQSIRAEQPDISADELYVLVYNSQRALEYIKQSNIVQERVGAEFRRRYINEHGEPPPPVLPQ